jgi:uncharacterized phage-associated protein
MVTVFDVAAYILEKCGPMTTMKLQKLVYYSQAWSLVWDSKPIFDEEIQAWANGPVCPALYHKHQGMFEIAPGNVDVGNPGALDATQIESIDAVLGYYADKSSHWLSELTHKEQPWIEARGTLRPGERGTAVISHAVMAEYYGSL